MSMKPISRRTLLKGTGAALALPWLESMVTSKALAASASVAPMRMGIYSTVGGTVIESWKPDKAGALGELPSILRPMQAHKDKLLVLSGLANHGRSKNVNAHEHCASMHLTAAAEVGKENGVPVTSISVDQMAARHLGSQTYLPSLEMTTTPDEWKYSYRDKGEPVPYEMNPRVVFDRMFRGREPMAPDWSARAKRRAENQAKQASVPTEKSIDRHILDMVMEDARRLQKKVGTFDKQKLQQYLASVESVERRIALVEAQAAEMMADGMGVPAEIPKGLPANAKEWDPIHQVSSQDPEVQSQVIDLMGDLFVLALQTDSTRVATMAVGSDGSMMPGVVTVGFERHFHTLEHQGGNPDPRRSDPIAREACRQVSHWFVQHFARVVDKMAAVDEGGTSLLDNTLLLFTSYMADGGHHREDYPVMLVGNAQGTLSTGRHIAYPQGTPMANLFVEMLDRVGVKVGEFGDSMTSPGAAFGGRLPDLV
ncbi:hypothetical protein Pan97_00360 [Bremerella volcania]|uniref:DUF1552 domain-containing protein n=1 Tax=Bremerella volcania TaxID=2527984 RepID=A0A518C1H3_9BACT|nr:DUF1552 domain-containing protein [Bremerella volcania]QDU73069.1 hypothetical protein Pan97_00360 [Bremerella volcania]